MDPSGIVSWVHIGDLHMTSSGEQNDLDLQAIVRQINSVFAGSINFVYLPGDVAEHGNREAYTVVRQALDELTVPWCAIIGDHDVHEKSHANFVEAMAAEKYYAFTVANIRFLALNAFDVPHPASFVMEDEQLKWLEKEMEQATLLDQQKVILLHCYPSDLKSGAERLQLVLKDYDVMLVEMGHTHYNEIANDGHTLYAATRSTGQIEEGPVGFSITCIDQGAISWKFFEPGQTPALMVTSPSDFRLNASSANPLAGDSLRIRAKVWSSSNISSVQAHFGDSMIEMNQVLGTRVWEANLPTNHPAAGLHDVSVTAVDENGATATDLIRIAVGQSDEAVRKIQKRDQDNQIGAWPEHGLLGTQLGPNKNGRKW